LACELIAHTNSRLAKDTLARFVQAFQAVAPLSSAELRALPVLLRLILVEDLQRVARRLARDGAAARGSVRATLANCVTSLRLLATIDWVDFFERTSRVEGVLREDPAEVYARQDAATRAQYREAVERLAERSDHDELQVARQAVALARRAGLDGARSHVGFYLVGPGRIELEAAVRYRPSTHERLQSAARAHPERAYFTVLALVTGLLLMGPLVYGWSQGGGIGTALLVVLVALLPVSELAVRLVHTAITRLIAPKRLPRLDFAKGIPPDCTTVVAVPAMLHGLECAARLAERLEMHYLSNSDPHLHFVLLTDFADAATESTREDEECVQVALVHIRALNARYSAGRSERFFLCHRRRLWNPAMGCWMGWERKRGKLLEFNRLLRGARDTSFVALSSPPERLPRARYVITLDVDTQLPREAASRLIATIAHPLNRPRFDVGAGRVVEGYGVLQPRLSPSLPSATRSLFAHLLAPAAGLDPYATASSDVYQDLFGRGSFTGKGIYEVDAFQAAVGNTFPDNHVLSHDLLEGNYARCGLVTDIALVENTPANYAVAARREHRWVRGDWQLLLWLFPTVPGPNSSRRPNPLPLLERWKIFDNLRRSLVLPSLIVLLGLGWTALPGSLAFWMGLALSIPVWPLGLSAISGAWLWRHGRKRLRTSGGRALLAIIFLADQACLLSDAVLRTLVRILLTRRHLLEWETTDASERRLGNRFVGFCRSTAAAPVLAGSLGLLMALARPEAAPAAALLLLAWLFSPAVAFWVSRRRDGPAAAPLPDEQRFLRRLARKTWDYFDTFTTAESHWLPPDSVAVMPRPQVAHRTSPTNLGFGLLSILVAHDLGYLSSSALLGRLERIFDTLERLPRFCGHFCNWYDMRTLEGQPPLFVSTVDSGNLLGCLLALRHALDELAEEPALGPTVAAGLGDTLGLLAEGLQSEAPPAGTTGAVAWVALRDTLEDSARRFKEVPTDLGAWDEWLQKMSGLTRRLRAQVRAVGAVQSEVGRWCRRLASQVRDWRAELARLAPWLGVLRHMKRCGELDSPPSLEAVERWRTIRARLVRVARLAELAAPDKGLLTELSALQALWPQTDSLIRAVGASGAAELLARARRLAVRVAALASAMDFRVLYNERRHLFSLGHHLGWGRLDPGHHDLLASETCLTSFLAIARGDVPLRHWFQLARPLTRGGTALLSWGGSMFEYLMPQLLLRSYAGTLLNASQRGAVAEQIAHGRRLGLPWGMSESGFLDVAGDFRYRSFGVSSLGFRRGLGQDRVVAPYATALALTVQPAAALDNFRALAADGAEGPYGFYEAVAYSLSGRPGVVRCYLAHHQGMCLVALGNRLCRDAMTRRFHAEPMVRATELLLQERAPDDSGW
jgi:cyclic beta-1,2-glucan synthetase